MSTWSNPDYPAHKRSHRARTARRLDAEERNAAWSALSLAEQFKRLNDRPGESARQRTRYGWEAKS